MDIPPHRQTLRPPVPAVNKILYREHALVLRALRAAPVAPFAVPAGHALDTSLASASYDSAAAAAITAQTVVGGGTQPPLSHVQGSASPGMAAVDPGDEATHAEGAFADAATMRRYCLGRYLGRYLGPYLPAH